MGGGRRQALLLGGQARVLVGVGDGGRGNLLDLEAEEVGLPRPFGPVASVARHLIDQRRPTRDGRPRDRLRRCGRRRRGPAAERRP